MHHPRFQALLQGHGNKNQHDIGIKTDILNNVIELKTNVTPHNYGQLIDKKKKKQKTHTEEKIVSSTNCAGQTEQLHVGD